MMHLGYLTSEYPGIGGRFGGIATSVKNLAEAMVQAGERVSVFLYGCERDEILWQNGVKIVCIANESKKSLTWWKNRKKIEKVINKHVENEQLQIVEAPDWTGITALIRPACPLVIKLHGTDAYFCHIEGRKQKWKNRFFEKQALHSADAIISVSRYTAELTAKLFGLKKEMHVIYNGIESGKFAIEEGDRISDGKTLLYFGTLIRKKGVLELPHIFNRIVEIRPETTLLLIGGDAPDIFTGSKSTWELMKPLFTQKALTQVRYLGKVPHEEIASYIRRSTLCLFPSFAEAFPVSWLEAMACAKPIVGSDRGWAYEAVEDGVSGRLVDPKDHGAFSQAVLDLMSDRDKSVQMGQAALERVRKLFDMQKITKEHLEFYSRITTVSERDMR